MFFVVTKLTFEPSPKPHDARDLAALIAKLRSRFHISVEVTEEFQKGGDAGIVVAAVHYSENKLSTLIDAVSDACENSGFGRIHSETSILEDFESFTEEYE